MTVLELGPGYEPRDADAVGLDRRPTPATDICADLDGGLPIQTGSVDCVIADRVLEHVRDLPAVMREIWRVCCDGAVVEGIVPHYRDRNAYTDPTHQQFFSTETFDFWDPDREHGGRNYFDAAFRVEQCRRIRRVRVWRSRPIRFRLRALK